MTSKRLTTTQRVRLAEAAQALNSHVHDMGRIRRLVEEDVMDGSPKWAELIEGLAHATSEVVGEMRKARLDADLAETRGEA